MSNLELWLVRLQDTFIQSTFIHALVRLVYGRRLRAIEEVGRLYYAGPWRTFPIRDQADLEQAWRLAGYAQNTAAVRARITSLAGYLGFHLPAEAEEGQPAPVYNELQYVPYDRLEEKS